MVPSKVEVPEQCVEARVESAECPSSGCQSMSGVRRVPHRVSRVIYILMGQVTVRLKIQLVLMIIFLFLKACCSSCYYPIRN